MGNLLRNKVVKSLAVAFRHFLLDESNIEHPPIEQAADEEVNESEDEYEDEEDALAGARVRETDFKFEDFVNRFAAPKVVKACAIALNNFQKNSGNTNHCIVKLLHRIAFDCKMPAMIFQASIFRTFQRIFRSTSSSNFKELAKFAVFIIRKFTEVAQKNPKIYMEMLFWKNSREAYDLEQGYGSYNEQSGASKKVWSELEEDELRRLFMEFKQNDMEGDIVDWITENLIDNTRTRRGVLKKLKDMCLLTDYKPGKKSGARPKPPKEWTEAEECELRDLFQQFRKDRDPLGCIMDRLTVRRPKTRIVEKLLSMGLVADKKELRKKRSKKSNAAPDSGSGSELTSSDSDNDGDNSDVSAGNSRQSTKTKNVPRKKKPKQSSGSKQKSKTKMASSSDVAKLLIEVVQSDMTGALTWIHESLEEAAEDFDSNDDDDDNGIPLVPITEESVAAMDKPLFQKLLRALGLAEPSDEQEAYWRIPVNFGLDTLQKCCKIINEALLGTLIVPETAEHINEQNNAEGSSDEDVFSKVKKFVTVTDEASCSGSKQVKRKKRTQSKNDSESEKENETNLDTQESFIRDILQDNIDVLKYSQLDNKQANSSDSETEDLKLKTKSKKMSRIIRENSDNESEKQSVKSNEDSGLTQQTNLLNKKRSRIIREDSDSEQNVSESENENSSQLGEEETIKRARLDCDLVQKPKRKRIISDDEDD